MFTSKVIYTGNLRTEAVHLKSENKIITDAPIDNFGKGDAFSPTDLMATSLLCCMMTVMGILAERKGWNLKEMEGTVLKQMADSPRRVSGIQINIKIPGGNWSDADKKMLENTALTCPVAKSLHPEILQDIQFEY